MNKDIEEYCRRRDTCQRVNAKLERRKAELHPIPVTSEVWKQVGIDLIGKHQCMLVLPMYAYSCTVLQVHCQLLQEVISTS